MAISVLYRTALMSGASDVSSNKNVRSIKILVGIVVKKLKMSVLR